jgi:hypothetical protein
MRKSSNINKNKNKDKSKEKIRTRTIKEGRCEIKSENIGTKHRAKKR